MQRWLVLLDPDDIVVQRAVTEVEEAFDTVRIPGTVQWLEDDQAPQAASMDRRDERFSTRFAAPWFQPLTVWNDDGEVAPAYPVGALSHHAGKTWRSLVDNNVWEPPVNWREHPDPGELPDWVQPTGAGDAYDTGALVKHSAPAFPDVAAWRSKIPANTTEPGTDGDFHRWWEPLSETPDVEP